MRLRTTLTSAIFATLSLAAAATLTGCWIDPQVTTCSTAAVPGIAVIVGNRANSPAPAIPTAELDSRLDALIRLSRSSKVDEEAVVGVDVIRLDGEPAITCVVKLDVNTHNDAADADAANRFRSDIANRVHEVQAQKPEADVLGALSLAAKSIGNGGTIFLIDSGLQTVNPLNFAATKLIGQEPDQILDLLRPIAPLPDLTGRTVVFAGIGYTAPPQERLHEGQQQLLVRLWQALAEQAGAKVVVLPQPNTDPAATGLPKVTPVAVPDPGNVSFACNSQTVLRNDGKVGFVPNRTDFLDEVSARNALGELVRFLASNPDARVVLTGNIAHYGTDFSLATRRAAAVKDLLVQLGAPAGRITAVGDGWGPYPSKTAGPDPVSDQQNRRVVVEVKCG